MPQPTRIPRRRHRPATAATTVAEVAATAGRLAGVVVAVGLLLLGPAAPSGAASGSAAGDRWPDPDDTFDTPGVDDLISKGIEAFFRKLVEDALNPLLELLGQTLLTTPTPDELPRIGELWEQSRQFSVASFVLLVMVAGIIVMGYETVQTRHSVKEILPRLVLAFLGANLSLLLAGKAILFANAASVAVMGEGLDPDEAAGGLSDLVLGSLANRGVFLILIGLAVAVMLIVLLVTYVVRVALTLILIAGAPLAIMCYALPQTEAVARWWCRAFAGVLAIQLGQSLTLVVFLRVFLDDDNFTPFGGATGDGMVNLLVCLALFYILVKIPFWIGSQVRTGSGRSLVGGLVRGFIAYKTFGFLRGGRAATAAAGRAAAGPRGNSGPGGAAGHGRGSGPPPAPPSGRGPGPGQPSVGPPSAGRPTGTPSDRSTQARTEPTGSAEVRRDLTSRPVPARDHTTRSAPNDRPVPSRADHQRRRPVGEPVQQGVRAAESRTRVTRDAPHRQPLPPRRATIGQLRSRRAAGPDKSTHRTQTVQARPARPTTSGQTPVSTSASCPNRTPSSTRTETEGTVRSTRAGRDPMRRLDRRGGDRPVRLELGPFGNDTRRGGAGLGARRRQQPVARFVGQHRHPEPPPPTHGLLSPPVSTLPLATAPSQRPGPHPSGPRTTPTATTRPVSTPSPPDTQVTVVTPATPAVRRPSRPAPAPPPSGHGGGHGERRAPAPQPPFPYHGPARHDRRSSNP